MKSILFTLLFSMAFITGYTQLYNAGGAITVQSGATLVIEGDYTSTSSGDILIDGTVDLKGHFENNSGTINAGSVGTLKFVGTSAQEIKGTASTTFNCDVEINNANGVSLTSIDQVMAKNLTLTSGQLALNTFNLTLDAATVLTADASNYIVTNGAGQLKRPVGATDVAFPVGSSTSYNPLVLNNIGTSDTYGVDFKATTPTGWTGTDHAVTGHWVVTEGAAGGSNLTVTAQWNLTDEQTNFYRTDCAVGRQVSGDDVDWAASGPASGTDPYTQSGAGFTDVGSFLVGDDFYLFINLDLDLFLAGPYSGGVMTTALNTAGLIPLTDPYAGNATVASIPGTAVDWVNIEFRDKTNSSAVLYSRAYFVDDAGNVLNTDGIIGAKVQGVPKDQYYIAVRHRNHLGVMTASTVDLNASNPAFNFTTGTGVYGTNPMRDMGSSIFALWAGDANGDGQVGYVWSPSDISPIATAVITANGFINLPVTGVYDNADVNLDGIIGYVYDPSDISQISITVTTYPGNPGTINNKVDEQLP
ncbi:MAG: hypothetical protein K0B08_11785 [Bacteroidales bacterium]|nr:hypothetical protein [Bacteroidales bacterium]